MAQGPAGPWELRTLIRTAMWASAATPKVYRDERGHERGAWIPGEHAIGIPHDVPVLGYQVTPANRLRFVAG